MLISDILRWNTPNPLITFRATFLIVCKVATTLHTKPIRNLQNRGH